MKKLILLTLASVLLSVASFALSPITGTPGVCTSGTGALTDATPGGTWTSSNTGVVTVGYTSGFTLGVSAGTAVITYAAGGSTTTIVYTVTTPPAPITGTNAECIGSTTTLTDATGGGVWSSQYSFIASVGTTSGVVTGNSGGVTYIYYTIAPGCSAMTTDTVKVTPTPDSVYGASGVCVGSSVTMSDMTPGGVWTSSNTSLATITSAGVLTGVSGGWVTISYAVTGTCGVAYAPMGYVLVSSGVSGGTISGPSTLCVGSSITLSDGVSGGVWTSSNTGLATVVSYSGVVTGVGTGSVDITYTVTNPCGSAYSVQTLTVSPGASVSAITGASSVCVGATTTLTDATSGGVWSSAGTTIATVSSTGVVTGVAGGTVNISYTVTGVCGATTVTKSITVNTTALPAAIAGATSVCLGSTTVLTDATSGGVWSSSSTTTATVSSGVVTGVALGIADITYTVSGTCGSAYVIHTVSVVSTVSAGAITGSSTVMTSLTTTLYDGVGGGVWSSSNTSVATIDPATGVVTGVAAGTATISYAVTGCGGTAYATFVITVTAANIIEGNVNFTGVSYTGPVKVWLITYDPLTFILNAVDSVVVTSSGTTAFYQFLGASTDSFRVKAAVMDTAYGGVMGYIPTYHISQFYWVNADAFWHIAPSVDAGEDITMQYGLVTSGPGFISGSVLAGANKSTVTYIPSVGMKIYCVDATTGKVVQQTTTDASGLYSFSSLNIGSYYVHPEQGGYFTTDYPTINITSLSPTAGAVGFYQHTLSHTIAPATPEVVNNKFATASVFAYPNPTTGKLNIQWQEPIAEKASVTISDITGRDIFKSTIDMVQGSGASQVDLSGLSNGLYVISIKSAAINYNDKIQVQK